MTYKFLYFILILLLLFEFSKSFNNGYNQCRENFASSPTENRLSKTEEDSPDDKFARDNEEILIMTQTPASPPNNRTFEFNYIRAPLNKGISIYVTQVKGGEEIQYRNYPPLLITSTNYKVLNLLGNGGYLINNVPSTLKYYIKFLSASGMRTAKEIVARQKEAQTRYNNCIGASTLSKSEAISKCKTILS